MNIQDSWEKALKHTEIIRPRVQPLQTFEATHLPYLFLAESHINPGDTVVRKGEVVVEKPALILPFNTPHFEGFDFEKEMQVNEDLLMGFFMVRGISFPSLKYNNKTDSLSVFEGKLEKAIQHYGELLQRAEDVHTGLIAGAEDCWQFSILIFTCGLVSRSADVDFKKLLDEYRLRGNSLS